MVVGRYVAGNKRQRWIVDKDQICCEYDHQLTVDIDDPVTAGARCQACDSSSSSSSWLFDHQYVSNCNITSLTHLLHCI